MSNIWIFSRSSEPLIQKLLQTANKLENNNKWTEKFKDLHKAYINDYYVQNNNEEHYIQSESNAEPNLPQKTVATCKMEENLEANIETEQNFYDIIEAEPSSRLDYIIEECLKNPNLIINLAEKLSIKAIEKICDTIFTKHDINMEFISLFCHNFLPKFLKRDQSWFALDMLHKAYKTFPEMFQTVLNKLIQDLTIPNTLLQEFVQNSGLELQKEFMSIIMHINLTSELFIHHLYTLYLVYKDCIKTDNIQNFIQSKLIENSSYGSNEKDFGRLLLAFLQAQKLQGIPTNLTMLERVVGLHKSVFKRPCLTVLNEIAKQQSSYQT